jgi:glutamine amidotransferase
LPINSKIAILDYGLGNPESVKNMLKKVGLQSKITSKPEEIADAGSIIIPGVGHFGRAMELLHNNGWVDVLGDKAIKEKTPVLGICLGMQLFFEHSEEGGVKGLGWIPGNVVRFKKIKDNLKIPHMGWTNVNPAGSSVLFKDDQEPLRYYFVHSYHVECKSATHEIASAMHSYNFTCAVQKDNITGVQFHPEKSHIYGQRFLKRYFDSLTH